MACRSQGGELQLGLEFPFFGLVCTADARAQGQKDKTGKTKDADSLYHGSRPLDICLDGTALRVDYNIFY
jgi:hypothetical protein